MGQDFIFRCLIPRVLSSHQEHPTKLPGDGSERGEVPVRGSVLLRHPLLRAGRRSEDLPGNQPAPGDGLLSFAENLVLEDRVPFFASERRGRDREGQHHPVQQRLLHLHPELRPEPRRPDGSELHRRVEAHRQDLEEHRPHRGRGRDNGADHRHQHRHRQAVRLILVRRHGHHGLRQRRRLPHLLGLQPRSQRAVLESRARPRQPYRHGSDDRTKARRDAGICH